MKVRQWPLLGLLFVVAFVGHDLLMAGEVAAAPPNEVGSAHHRSGAHASRSDTHAPQTHEPTPEHPDTCLIGQSAVARSPDSFECGDQDLVISEGIVAGFVSPYGDDGAFLWEEPHWPPGTLRALFQVYRM
jgi:hypothetical protein